MIKEASFIEFPEDFNETFLTEAPAPLFRRRFEVSPGLQKATLSVCGLGYGYYYLNGQPATTDLFTAPVSDYTKTLWHNVYDVTALLSVGENLIAAILGNGFYNEAMETTWGHHKAPWRDGPKLLLSLCLEYQNRTEQINSDDSWLCSKQSSPVRFNQLRSGETYDSRLSEDWRTPGLEDSGWVQARLCASVPSGVLRECMCQPVSENCEYKTQSLFQRKDGCWVFDFGQNMSGYVRLKLNQSAGDCIKIEYAEQIDSDGFRKDNDMAKCFPGYDFQTDRFISNGKETVWSPRFTYHGFRFAIIEGLKSPPDEQTVSAVFVCQAVDDLSTFECSNDLINKIYSAGKIATLSNLFYMPTDCPTREKLGWANDAQSSTEQMLQNFEAAPLFEKWLQDIIDSMTEDGAIPGIIPSPGWGYEWGTGPISTGVLFELPIKIYEYTGNDAALRLAYPAFLKHLEHVVGHTDPADGLIGYGLCDWAGPFEKPDEAPTPVKLTDTLLAIKFHRMAAFAARHCGDIPTAERLDRDGAALETVFKKAYVGGDSRCNVNEQTPVAMMIALGVYDSFEPLKEQLYELVLERDFHHNCGMLGMQYLYTALNICGFQEMAFKIVTAKGRPSYSEWFENGATTLWEMWNLNDSKNHHMNSCVLSWMMKTLVGLCLSDDTTSFKTAVIQPFFMSNLSFCKGTYDTAAGTYSVMWERQGEQVLLNLHIPEGASARVLLTGFVFNSLDASCIELAAGSHSLLCLPV